MTKYASSISRECDYQLPDGSICKKPFIPTSNVQKKCPDHSYHALHKKYVAKSVCATTVETPIRKIIRDEIVRKKKENSFNGIAESQSHRVLEVLIAAGFITREKVEQAREIVKSVLL